MRKILCRKDKMLDKLPVFCGSKKDFCKSFRIRPINKMMLIEYSGMMVVEELAANGGAEGAG